ncbi:unnamed protein product, partial [Durusdinium trenchii]
QPQNAKEVALNSINCQEAWTFLYRLCRDGEKKKVDPEILASWRAGGPARSKLLSDFVRKVYNKEVDHTTNRARLETKIQGAIQHCTKKKLTKQCLYEKVTKQGSEKMKELEELMNGSGFFNENFSFGLGDVMELSDDEGVDVPGPEPKPKPKPGVLVAKYKKALLNRRAVFKETSEKWHKETPGSGKLFEQIHQFLNFCSLVIPKVDILFWRPPAIIA